MIRLGIIGLGEVSQLMHLPILHDLNEIFEITAVSDVSPSLVAFIQKKYSIKAGYLNGMELIESPDVDAVLVLSPDQYHAEYTAHALKNNKHVFIEKPATLNVEDLEGLIELKKQYPSQIVMVGFMRRYSENFLKAKEIMESNPKQTEYLRFRDIILEGPFFINQTRPTFKSSDIPSEIIEEGARKTREQLDVALGKDATDAQRQTYRMMTGLGVHSLSAVRELFGVPKKIHSVTTCEIGEQVIVVMEFDGFLATYELINNQQVVQFDAAIEVFQKDRKIHVKYETPYIRHQGMSVEVTESTGVDTKTTKYGPSYVDPFETELKLFAESIKTGKEPKTDLEDSLADLKLFKTIATMAGEKK